MYVTMVRIQNYRAIRDATVSFKEGVNVIVGDNEAGKSTLLEAIQLAITGQLGGRSIRYQLHPYLFNQEATREFTEAMAAKKMQPPPEIRIEVYFDDDDKLVHMRGTNNSPKVEATGVYLRIKVAEECREDFANYVSGSNDDHVPIEFFDVEWMSFAFAPMNSRTRPIKSRLIDASSLHAGRGAGRYLSQLVEDQLSPREKIDLSLAYRSMKHTFEQSPPIKRLNKVLAARKGQLSDKELAIAMEVSATGEWGEGVIPLVTPR